jgi:hypothetical protein
MYVTCLSEEQDASLPSTKRVVLRTNYSKKDHNINTPNNHKQAI